MSVETVVLLVFWNLWYFFLWFFDEYKVKKSNICLEIFSNNISLYYDFLFI